MTELFSDPDPGLRLPVCVRAGWSDPYLRPVRHLAPHREPEPGPLTADARSALPTIPLPVPRARAAGYSWAAIGRAPPTGRSPAQWRELYGCARAGVARAVSTPRSAPSVPSGTQAVSAPAPLPVGTLWCTGRQCSRPPHPGGP